MTTVATKHHARRYRALVGLNYRPSPTLPEKRIEIGAVVDDLPILSVPWLLAQRVVVLVADEEA